MAAAPSASTAKSTPMSTVKDMTVEQKRAFLEQSLKDMAKYIVAEAQISATSRNIIYKELEKNVDGDDNALVDLFSGQISALSKDASFASAMSVFSDLEGNRYFPQVYINNYTDLKNSGRIGSASDILAVFYTGDESKEEVTGYRLNAKGDWEPVEMVNESTAAGKEVWVFSLNETFTDKIDLSLVPKETVITQNPFYDDGHTAAKPTGGEPCVDGLHYWPYIQNMQIRKHNESWLAGKSDINIKTYTGWNTYYSTNPCNASLSHIMWTNNPDGELPIAKFMRYMIPNTGKQVNFGYAGSWCPGPANVGGWQGDAFNYVIFERDAWPVGEKKTYIDNNGYTATIWHRSTDSYYDQGIILFWGAPGTHMNGYARDISGQIKFNSRL